MKTIFLILPFLLISILVKAQAPPYTKINMGYYWNFVAAKGMHAPGFNTTPSLQAGQWGGAGAIGIDTVLHKFFFYSSDHAWHELASGGNPSGNYGNVQLNRNGIFSTPASDTLNYSTTGGFNVKNIITTLPGIGIGTLSLNSNAILDVTSTTKGILGPRMTGAQMTAISGPPAGLLVYNTDSSAYCYYSGTAWVKVGSGGGGSSSRFGVSGEDATATANRNFNTTGTYELLIGNATKFRVDLTSNGTDAGYDMFYRDSVGSQYWKRLPKGTPGQSLQMLSTGGIGWAAQAGGGTGTVTTFSKTDGYGITSSVTNPTTTPNHTIAVDTATLSTKYQRLLKIGADFTANGDSLFLKGDFVNIKDFGAVADNTTDNTAALNAAIATGKPVFIPPTPAGTFFKYTTGITLNDDQMLFGMGRASHLKYTGTLRGITMGTHSTVSNFWLQGNGKASGNQFETGILLYQKVGWRIDGMYITQFGGNQGANGGGGINVNNLDNAETIGGHISNCWIDSCKAALNIEERGEYLVLTNSTFSASDYGLCIGAGNVYATNCNSQHNTYGLFMFNGTNDGHGFLSGMAFNHNTFNQLADLDVSESIANCGFYYGGFIIKNCNSVRFVNCDMSSLDSFHLENNTNIYRISCLVGKTTLGNEIPGWRAPFSGEAFNDVAIMNLTTNTDPRYFLRQINSRDTSETSGPLVFNNVPFGYTNKLKLIAVDTTNGNIFRTVPGVGTSTNDNAFAGAIGEEIHSIVAVASAVSLTNNTPANMTSISLTAGDWDVTGIVKYLLGAATVTKFDQGVSTTSATLPSTDDAYRQVTASFTTASDTTSIEQQTVRISLSGTTTIYLVAQSSFSAGTVKAYGYLRARRMR